MGAPSISHFNLSLVCSKYSESFKSRLVKRISVFRLSVCFFHCDKTKGKIARAVITQSHGSTSSGLFVFLIGSVGEADTRGFEVTCFSL